MLWCLAGGSSCPAEEGIKNITETTEVKPLEAPAEGALGTAIAEMVVGRRPNGNPPLEPIGKVPVTAASIDSPHSAEEA